MFHRGHVNSFDGLRLIAALRVLWLHPCVLLGLREPAPLGDSLGSIAVMIFFTISSVLVAQRWYYDLHLMRLALRRALRAWPALLAATLAIAMLRALLTSLPMHNYFGHDLRKFVSENARLPCHDDSCLGWHRGAGVVLVASGRGARLEAEKPIEATPFPITLPEPGTAAAFASRS